MPVRGLLTCKTPQLPSHDVACAGANLPRRSRYLRLNGTVTARVGQRKKLGTSASCTPDEITRAQAQIRRGSAHSRRDAPQRPHAEAAGDAARLADTRRIFPTSDLASRSASPSRRSSAMRRLRWPTTRSSNAKRTAKPSETRPRTNEQRLQRHHSRLSMDVEQRTEGGERAPFPR